MVLVAECIAAVGAFKFSLCGMGTYMGLTHDFGFESPSASWKVASKWSIGVVNTFMFTEGRLVCVRVATNVTQYTALAVDLPMCMNGCIHA